MNNAKKLSLLLLLSLGVSGVCVADGCDDKCTTTDNGCNACTIDTNDCEDCSFDSCAPNSGVSTFLRPRDITTDLTYRNALYFYNKYHDARCNFFTWDTTYLFQRNRDERCLGAGFLGKNPITIAEEGGDINSLNFGLARTDGDFTSTVSICPERSVFGWLNQMNFNLDCFCTGLWFDLAFAVVRARHKLRFNEVVENPGQVEGQPTTVEEAFNNLNVFGDDCRHTGVDDVEVRLGYDWYYCNNDHVGLYFTGVIPTGKSFDNSRWFQPVVGSKHGAAGVGLTADYTIWDDECNNTNFVAMTEFKYHFRFRHDERRAFDLNNGPLSRFLLVAPESDPFAPVSIAENLVSCVRVEPRHTLQWWLGFHYQWCNWGAEFAYNLFWRDRERICGGNFDFNDFGLFDKTRCGNLTSNSQATIGQNFGEGTPDATFTRLTADDVNLQSGAAQKALSHKVSGTVGYNNVWCDCYPYYVGFGGGFEFAGKRKARTTLENWSVFGKLGISF